MMKLVNKQTKEEYSIGKPAYIKFKDDTGSVEISTSNLTLSLAKRLYHQGILELVEEDDKKKDIKEEETLEFYIKRLGNKLGLDYTSTKMFLKALYKMYPASVLSMILKEIALTLDEKYTDNIRNSEHIYSICLTNGLITEIPKKAIKSYKCFAAFRTIEDAKIACKVCKEYLKDIFKDNAK